MRLGVNLGTVIEHPGRDAEESRSLRFEQFGLIHGLTLPGPASCLLDVAAACDVTTPGRTIRGTGASTLWIGDSPAGTCLTGRVQPG